MPCSPSNDALFSQYPADLVTPMMPFDAIQDSLLATQSYENGNHPSTHLANDSTMTISHDTCKNTKYPPLFLSILPLVDLGLTPTSSNKSLPLTQSTVPSNGQSACLSMVPSVPSSFVPSINFFTVLDSCLVLQLLGDLDEYQNEVVVGHDQVVVQAEALVAAMEAVEPVLAMVCSEEVVQLLEELVEV
jgi:hypothetical protein